MSKKKISQNELETILRAVALFPDGAMLDQIMRSLVPSLTRRTLQRRLKLLINNNILHALGQTSSRRYRVPISPARRNTLGEPDPFRMRYRDLIHNTLTGIVRGCMDKKAAAAIIIERACENVQPEEQSRFIEVIESELIGLHEGNIARYRLRPVEYESWRKIEPVYTAGDRFGKE